MGLVLLVGIGLRVWILRSPLGAADLDEATVGIQARHFVHGRVAAFFPQQSYGGTLETAVVAALTAVMGPVGLKATPMLLHLVACVVTWRAAVRLTGSGFQSLLAPAILWVGSAVVTWQSTKERGFYGVAIVIAAATLLLVLRLAGGSSWHDWYRLGFLAGVAVWTTPLLAAAVVPPVAWAVAVRRDRRAVVGLPGVIIGSLPWVVWNARHGWRSLTVPPAFGTTYGARLVDSVSRLPVVVGAETPWNSGRTLVPAVVVLLGLSVMVVVGSWTSRGTAPGLLPIALIGSMLLQAGNGLAIAVGPDPRYLYPLAPLLALVLAAAVASLPRGASGPATILVVVVATTVAAWGAVGLRQVADDARPDPFLSSPGIEEVVRYLDRTGVRAAMTEENGNQITFYSKGRIRAASYGVPRFADLERIGWSRGLRTYVMRRGYFGGDERRLAAHLRRARIGYRTRSFGVYVIFRLDAPVSPGDVPLSVFGGRYGAPTDP